MGLRLAKSFERWRPHREGPVPVAGGWNIHASGIHNCQFTELTNVLGLCFVPLCSKRGGHKFTTDAAVTKLWLIAIKCNKCNPKKESKMWCRNHFKRTN